MTTISSRSSPAFVLWLPVIPATLVSPDTRLSSSVLTVSSFLRVPAFIPQKAPTLSVPSTLILSSLRLDIVPLFVTNNPVGLTSCPSYIPYKALELSLIVSPDITWSFPFISSSVNRFLKDGKSLLTTSSELPEFFRYPAAANASQSISSLMLKV